MGYDIHIYTKDADRLVYENNISYNARKIFTDIFPHYKEYEQKSLYQFDMTDTKKSIKKIEKGIKTLELEDYHLKNHPEYKNVIQLLYDMLIQCYVLPRGILRIL